MSLPESEANGVHGAAIERRLTGYAADSICSE